jgi:hypothetical protein
MKRSDLNTMLQLLEKLLLPFLTPVGKVIVLLGEIAVQPLLSLRMRFLAAGIFTPMVAIAVLLAIFRAGGPIPETPAVMHGLRALVGFQTVCGILAFLEMAYNESSLGRLSNA